MKQTNYGHCAGDNVFTVGGCFCHLFVHPVTDVFFFRWSERIKGRAWTEDAMRRNVSIRVTSRLFRAPYATLKNRIGAVRLQQNYKIIHLEEVRCVY
jgi:hypothetical protein